MQKRSLGRGLSDLLSSVGPVSTQGVIEVEVERIEANPYQPRRVFADAELADLAASIRRHGVLQPLLVRVVGESYQLIAGERRLRAAQSVGVATVPCLVHATDDLRSLMLALIENLQRADLNAVEQARAYRQMMEEFGMTQEEVADHIGKSRPAVANCLRLLALPTEVLDAVSSGALSEGHGRALLAVRDQPARLYEICQQVMAENLSVRQTEELVRKPSELSSAPQRQRFNSACDGDAVTDEVSERLQQALATKVLVTRRVSGGGTVLVRFHDDEELFRITEMIAPQEAF